MRDVSAGEERGWTLAAYGLFLIAPASGGITVLVSVILAYLRRDGASGGIYQSHYRNLILVFWVWLAVAFVGAAGAIAGGASVAVALLQSWPGPGPVLYRGLLTLGLLFLAGVLVLIWYYWRLVKGLVRLMDDRPY
jgi:uncharacterized membrane protein